MTHASSHDGCTTSLWTDNVELPDTPRLEVDLTAEICVVGAGVAGLSVAYELVRRGHHVIAVEAGAIAGGQSGRTTAHLAWALDDRIYELARLHGERGAQLAVKSHARAIDRIQEIVAFEGIECAFDRMDGYLFLGPGQSPSILDHELEAAARAGMSVSKVVRAPLPFNTGPALLFPRQGHFQPLRYLAGLASAILGYGGSIYTRTHIDRIEGGEPARLVTQEGHVIHADSVVVATNVPVNDRTVMHTKQAPYRTYVIAVPISKGIVPRGLYWDTLDPYHYVRIHPRSDYDLLVVGGEDHKTGQDDHPEHRWKKLEVWVKERFPMIGEVSHRWSGQIIEPVDGLAFIGRNPMDTPNIYIATGDSGHGMTHGAIAGMLLSDLIEGKENAWSELYDPRRRTLRAAREFLKENANVARQYSDHLRSGEVDDPVQIKRGEGAILRRGLQLMAVHVDDHGVTHACSAVCPHLGGVVHWNTAEKTWDCPCHGSRFSPEGEVIEGPAIVGLEPLPVTRLRKPEERVIGRGTMAPQPRR
jgi:glycine/D-amino acid oxidase-like deaminating enzyme/nitrite reductase/ring-hydroxylating ferredoxin subunit